MDRRGSAQLYIDFPDLLVIYCQEEQQLLEIDVMADGTRHLKSACINSQSSHLQTEDIHTTSQRKQRHSSKYPTLSDHTNLLKSFLD